MFKLQGPSKSNLAIKAMQEQWVSDTIHDNKLQCTRVGRKKVNNEKGHLKSTHIGLRQTKWLQQSSVFIQGSVWREKHPCPLNNAFSFQLLFKPVQVPYLWSNFSAIRL